MVKNVLKTPLSLSLLLLFILSCSIPPTYSRANIEKAIKTICKDELAIDVVTALAGETVWIYAPFKKLITEGGQWDQETLEDRRKIFFVLGRVFLSLDNPPKFYCLLASGISGVGVDTYTIGYVSELIKFQQGLISSQDYGRRIAFKSFPNPQALGDTQGKHMQAYDIQPAEFADYLADWQVKNKK